MRKGQILILMENRTSGDVLGPADVWGQRAMSSCPAATAMILLLMILCSAKGLGVTVDSFSAQSRRGENPSRTVGLRALDGSAPLRLAGMGVRSIARTS
jgi:hypothetical protein